MVRLTVMRRALWAVPVVVFLGTFGVFGVRHPGSVKVMLMNGGGMLMIGAAVVAAAIFTWASKFRPKIQPFVPLVITAGILGGAVYAEVPFERTSTQNQMLVKAEVIGVTATTASPPPTTMVDSPAAPPRASTTTAQPQAIRYASGNLKGINHAASGTVSSIEAPNGEWVLRFENFHIQGVPAPVLYVVAKPDAREPYDSVSPGPFTATDGDLLDVPLPSGLKPVDGWTVLIWCDKFDTPVANATLR